MPDQESALRTLFERTIDRLGQIQPTVSPNEQKRLIRAFMAELYQLGLLTLRTPALHQSPLVAQWILESTPLVERNLTGIVVYVANTEESIPDALEYGGWAGICEHRSALEFLLDFFRETHAALTYDLLGLDTLDEELHNYAMDGYIEPDRFPTGIPHSHWWWYPDAVEDSPSNNSADESA